MIFGETDLSRFEVMQTLAFVSIILDLDLRETTKTRIALENIHFVALGTLLGVNPGYKTIGSVSPQGMGVSLAPGSEPSG